jgi:plasmid replication initiation protein
MEVSALIELSRNKIESSRSQISFIKGLSNYDDKELKAKMEKIKSNFNAIIKIETYKLFALYAELQNAYNQRLEQAQNQTPTPEHSLEVVQ